MITTGVVSTGIMLAGLVAAGLVCWRRGSRGIADRPGGQAAAQPLDAADSSCPGMNGGVGVTG